MKRTKIITWLIFLIGYAHILSAGDYPFVTRVEINEVAINRFLAKQFNESSFVKSWSSSYNGNTYSLSIERPIVVIQNNAISLEIGINLNNQYYLLRPTVTVPPITLTNSDVKATFTQFQNYLNTLQFIANQWEKDIIHQKLHSIQWLIYQGTLISESVEITDVAVITTSIDSVTTKFIQGSINLSFYFTNKTKSPEYFVKAYHTDHYGSTKTVFHLKSNVKVSPTFFRFYNTAGNSNSIIEIRDFSGHDFMEWVDDSYELKYNFDFVVDGAQPLDLFRNAIFHLKRGGSDIVLGVSNYIFPNYHTETMIFGQ